MNQIVIKTIAPHIIAEMLKKTKNKILNDLTLESVSEDGTLARILLEEFDSETTKYKEHILLDHDERGLLIVASSHVDNVFKEVVEQYKDGLLKALAEYEHFRNTPEHIDSAQCFEWLTAYIQRRLLGKIAHRWYLDLSDYIVDSLYAYFGEDTIRALPEQYNQDENTLQSLNMDVRAFDEEIANRVFNMDRYFSVKHLISVMDKLEAQSIDGDHKSKKIREEDYAYNSFIENTYDLANFIIANRNKVYSKYSEKLIELAEKLSLNEKSRLGLEDDDTFEKNDKMLAESEKLGFKLRKHIYKHILKGLEWAYLGKQFYVQFEYFEPNEVHFHTIQEIKIEEHGIELWNTDTSTYIDLEAHEENEHSKNETVTVELTELILKVCGRTDDKFEGMVALGDDKKLYRFSDDDVHVIIDGCGGYEIIVEQPMGEDKKVFSGHLSEIASCKKESAQSESEDDTDISETTQKLVPMMSKVETSFKGDYKDEAVLNEPGDTSPFLDFLSDIHAVATFVLESPEEFPRELVKVSTAFNYNEKTRMKNSTLTHDENEKMLDESESLGYELRKLIYAYLGVPQAARPTLEIIKANFAENGFHYRVGDIVEMETEGLEGEHYAFVSRFYGETYVVGKLDVKVGCYYLIPLKRYREASHVHTSLFVRSVDNNGHRVEFADYDLAVKGQSETEATDATEDDRDMKVEVKVYLAQLFSSIGIDRPSNHDDIFDFIVNDVSEVADPINYHSGDMAIAFRRFIERGADG